MPETQTLTSDQGNIDVTWTLEQYTDWSGNTLWVVRIKICNKTGKRLKGRLVENPWRDDAKQVKTYMEKDDQGNETTNWDEETAKKKGVNLNIPAGKCEDHLFDFRKKPHVAYTDIYTYDADGKLNESWTWGSDPKLEPVVISSLPPKQERTLCLAAPLPYFMSLDKMTSGPVAMTISDVAVPKGFVFVDSWPAIGEPVDIQHAQRGNQLNVVLRQVEPIPEGSRLGVLITQKVAAPRELTDWPSRQTSITLVNDAKPPKIIGTTATLAKDRVEVEAVMKDACSGVASARLTIGRNKVGASLQPSSLTSDGEGNQVATFTFPRAFLDGKPTLTLRVSDYAGNVAKRVLDAPKPPRVGMRAPAAAGKRTTRASSRSRRER